MRVMTRHLPLERLRWLILGLLFSSTVINYVDRQALSVLLPTLRAELGLTSADYGTITMVFMLAYTFAQVGAGMCIDKIGTRLSFGYFVVGWSMSALLHALARGAVSLGLFRCLLALSEAGNWPAGTKAVARWFPPQRRGLAMAIFDSGAAVGAVVAPPLVALLALQFGWRAAFVGTALLGFVWLIGWLRFYDEPERHPWLSGPDRAKVLAEAGTVAKTSGAFGAALRGLIGTGPVWGLLVTRMLATPVWWFYVFWLPDYLSQARGFSLVEIGLYGWIPYLAVDFGKVAGGVLSDRLLARGHGAGLARKSVMAVGALAMTAGLLVVGAPNPASAIAWVCVATFGFGMWSANVYALHADIFPAETLATAVGLTGTGSSVGGAIFTFAAGMVVDKAGYGPVFWTIGIIPLLACLTLIFCVGRLRQTREDGERLTQSCGSAMPGTEKEARSPETKGTL
ncbi:MAG TPA: MFS transporter [Verrucomicrobiae bacterium]|nr:MFS transporter [Verrucomicrobiae bacterium]